MLEGLCVNRAVLEGLYVVEGYTEGPIHITVPTLTHPSMNYLETTSHTIP